MRKKTIQLDYDFEDFDSVKRWKRELTRRGINGGLSENTWKSVTYWIVKLLKHSRKTPDELITEAAKDNELAESRLADVFSWCKNDGLNENSCIIGIYGTLRGFYSHNKIDTRNWHSPKTKPKEVDQTDANYPLFSVNQNNRKLTLNKSLLRDFLKSLNRRDEVIALCLISSGLDIGDLIKLNLEFVRNQDNHKRLFLSNFRNKTGEWIKTFFSIESTNALRKYIREKRFNADDSEPIFVSSIREKRNRVDSASIATNFRIAQQRLGIYLSQGKQGPLRPKRLRKVFRTACQIAAVGDDMARIFMGQKSQSSKIYLAKSREELEIFYEMVEPFITLYSEISDDTELSKLKQQHHEEKEELRQHLQIFATKFQNLEKRVALITSHLS
ncbi:hypothetical protein [Nitrosopumilus sp.]|uniref:tyrosine-type recombinase/integrase n=1 Tax=Nitrosopumilus sp. TaxID=2024843 RepID=UPI0034A039EF